MPALPSPGNVLKVRANWGVDGDATANTIHHYRFSGSALAADLTTFAENFVTQGETVLAALCTSFTGMLSATVRDLSSDMGIEVTAGTPWVGTRTGDRLAPGTAFLCNHSIRRHYRGGQPRSYLPLGSGTDVASTGLWTDAFVTAALTGTNNLLFGMSDETIGGLSIGALCNVSYYGPPNRTITGSTGRVRTVSTLRGAPIVNDIFASSGQKKIASQRRRNRAA